MVYVLEQVDNSNQLHQIHKILVAVDIRQREMYDTIQNMYDILVNQTDSVGRRSGDKDLEENYFYKHFLIVNIESFDFMEIRIVTFNNPSMILSNDSYFI